MISKRSEKAIKAWLKVPLASRYSVITDRGRVNLYDQATLVATFTLKSIIAKRYPRKKKAVKK